MKTTATPQGVKKTSFLTVHFTALSFSNSSNLWSVHMHTPLSDSTDILAQLLLAKLLLESKGWGRGQNPIPYHTCSTAAAGSQPGIGVAWVWLNVCLHIVSTEGDL